MIKTLFIFTFFAIAISASGQNNILLLRKNNKTFKTFFEGKYIAFDTKQKSTASGIITKIGKDSLYIRYFEIMRLGTEYGGVYFDTSFRYTTAIHIKDIGAVHPPNVRRSKNGSNGTLFLIASGGVLVLGAVNGLYRNESINEWYKPSSFISAGVLGATGLLLRASSKKKFVIGKKYQLKILSIN